MIRIIFSTGKKHTIKNVTGLLSLGTKIFLIFHVLSCVWILIGSIDDIRTDGFIDDEGKVLIMNEGKSINGWVTDMKAKYADKGPDGDYLPTELRQIDIYLTAIYFSVSTSTTVGYGDFYGNTTYERLYLLPAEFIGICMFSIISGITGNLLDLPTLISIINEKKNDVKMYLQSIDRARQEDAQLDDDIYDNTVHFIEHSY